MIRIGIIGDFDREFLPHKATMDSLLHSSKLLNTEIKIEWIATDSLINYHANFELFSGIWIGPGKLYKSIKGAIAGIKIAREKKIPILGTCRGFQHLMIEFARNKMNLIGKEIEENDPFLSKIISNRTDCSLDDKWIDIKLKDNSIAKSLYEQSIIKEQDVCSFEINKDLKTDIEKNGLRITGIDTDLKPRIVELIENNFCIGTLYVPQLNSTFDNPHPIVTGFLKASMNRWRIKNEAQQGM